MSRHVLALVQDEQTQLRPCDDSRYKMGASVAQVLKRTKLSAAVVGAACAKYLLLISTNAYLVALRARGMLARLQTKSFAKPCGKVAPPVPRLRGPGDEGWARSPAESFDTRKWRASSPSR